MSGYLAPVESVDRDNFYEVEGVSYAIIGL